MQGAHSGTASTAILQLNSKTIGIHRPITPSFDGGGSIQGSATMKTINQKLPRTADDPPAPSLAPSPVLEFVLALARHRAHLDHENAKLTKEPVTDTETIVSKSVTCIMTLDDDFVVPTEEASNV
jgi:hypothetical protein